MAYSSETSFGSYSSIEDSSIARFEDFMIRMDNWRFETTFYDYNSTSDNISRASTSSSTIPSTFYDISRACTPPIG